jgi:sugar phosphate isomerase/epimerase
MMRIAIQEDMLSGRSVVEKLENARLTGFEGVEFWAERLTERVPEIATAIEQTGIQAAAVNLGRRDGYLSPELRERERAISEMRQAMTNAVDIGAGHVVFVPHFGGPRMPDLTPYRSPIELESEMMVWLLRTVSDLAYAIGVELDMLPINHYETYFMNRLEQAALFRRKVKDHPHIKIAAGLFHMALEESNILEALRTHGKHIGYIHLADSNYRLPGQGMVDFAAASAVLREIEYDGWLTFACGDPGNNQPRAGHFMTELRTSLALVKTVAGIA